MVDAILDTGCYTKISCSKKHFITYKKEFIQVEGISSHNIVGTGTLQYTVIDDNGHTINLTVKTHYTYLRWVYTEYHCSS